ncbi:MAG: LytTR family DNA-binding domain-containing protein [Muribaculaceae bacterium]|nr:LytTR family DNA-binding domain-containing protein [Muribaculaceae bacterium]
MRKITCTIVDDEPLAVRLLESFAARVDFLELKGSFTDSIEAMSAIRKNPVDLLFLDIQMPDLDGISLARMLPPETKVVFTTAFKEYAFESYDVAAVDFLLKPIRYDKFLRACEKAGEWFSARDAAPATDAAEECREIYLRADGELRKIEVDKILYVEGMKDYVRFFIEGSQPVVTHLTMKNVEELLPRSRFMRVSRSHIVALPHIRTIDRNLCLYIGNTMIRVTDLYKTAFEEYLNSRMAR